MAIINLICSYPICAAHRLARLDWSDEKNNQVFGKCANTHGHQYTMELHLRGEPDVETGMLINGFAVDEIVAPFIRDQFDHKYLNEDVAFFKETLPTAENIAVWVYQELQGQFSSPVRLHKVKIYETPELAVEYCGE